MQQKQDIGELKGLKIARGVRSTNHVQFADDTILLGGASTVITERFKKVLSTFLKALDGKINTDKSKYYGWNCLPGNMARISRILGFDGITDWDYFRYLGIPIFKGKKKKADWLGLIDKILKKKSTLGELDDSIQQEN